MKYKCLIVKTSSLGDVLHLMPALTDVLSHRNDVVFDWVVESSFAEMVRWHPAVNKIIPCELRKWRKNPFKYRAEIKKFKVNIQAEKYDYVIDAQGLLKSAWVAKQARGEKYGLSWSSLREPLASLFYQHKISVAKGQHAILRLRQLFAKIFDYELIANAPIDYGLSYQWKANCSKQILFLHGTTWVTKFWVDEHWIALSQFLEKHRYEILLPWGSDKEKQTADRIAQKCHNARVLPPMNLSELAKLFTQVEAVVAVDTGLSHVAAACGVPIVGVYGATDAKLTGALGERSHHLQSQLDCSPCLKRQCRISKDVFAPCQMSITPNQVLDVLLSLKNSGQTKNG